MGARGVELRLNVKIGYLSIKDKRIEFVNKVDDINDKVVEYKNSTNYVCLVCDCRAILHSTANLLELLIVKMKEELAETLLMFLSGNLYGVLRQG